MAECEAAKSIPCNREGRTLIECTYTCRHCGTANVAVQIHEDLPSVAFKRRGSNDD